MTPLPDTATILIVDDTPSNLGVVVNLLEDRGYRVAIAQDGEEGLQRAQFVLPDLILLDVMLPGADGFEICRQLKSLDSTCHIPVIFMTSLASVEHKVMGFEAGGVDYLTKPLQVEEVIARVGTHLKLHAAQRRLEEQNAELDRHREELERRVAERTAELTAREREFRTLVENAPDEIARYDRHCRYFYINPQHERTLGLSLAQVQGKTPTECFPGHGDVVGYETLMREVIATGQRASFEATLPDAGKESHYHNILLVAERDAAGEITGVLAIGRDVTAQRRAQQALAEREREFRTLAENLPDNLARYDTGGSLIYMNSRLERFLGKRLADRTGLTPLEASSGSPVYVEYEARLSETIATGQPSEMEMEFPDAGCGVRYHVIRFVAESDEAGRIVGALAIGRDITERKRAERDLHLLNRALDNSFDATYLLDEDLRVRYVNEAAVRALGYRREELLSMSLLDIDPNITREAVGEFMRQTAATGRFPGTVESLHRRKDGATFPIEVGASTFVHEGETLFLTVVRDISDRKEAERRLHEQQQAIQAVVEHSPDGIIRYDHACRRIYLNSAMQAVFGIPAEQVIGTSPAEFSPLPEAYVQTLKQALENGTEHRLELPFRDAQGGVRWADLRFAPEFGPDGAVVSVLAVGRDITERKHVEEELLQHRERLEELVQARTAALAENKARLRALIDNLPFEFWAMDTDLRYTMQNATSMKNYGPVIGKRIADLGLPPEVMAQWEAQDRRALAGEILHGEYEKEAGGERQVFASVLSPVMVDDSVVGIVGVAMDITARKRAEEAIRTLNSELEQRVRLRTAQLEATNRVLRESEQRYREIFDNAVEGMYLLEVTEDGRFRNLDINPALAASTGIPREAMIGRFVDETVPEEIGRSVVAKYRRCVEAATTIEENIQLDLPSGRREYLSTMTPIAFGGRIHRIIGISRDITELMRVERALEESQAQLRGLTAHREEAREEERKHIAREVHDELGQLLTGLKLNVSVLAHQLAAGPSPLREPLHEAMRLTDRALAVARNVASTLRPAALDMGIVAALEWLARSHTVNTGVRCRVRVDCEDIQLDERKATALFRIAQESLTNVARHARADRVDISLARIGDVYRLKVRDNGVGFHTDGMKQNSYGLVGMRERALLLGGDIVIDSRPGGGTEVQVHIPACNGARVP